MDAKLESLSVVFAEDEPFAAEMISRLLSRRFKNLYIAQDGRECLDLYFKHKPDILITDINMPFISGLDVIRKIHKMEGNPRIIIITAYNSQQSLLDAIELGVTEYLIKPIKLTRLENAIDQVCEKIILEKKLFESHQYYEAFMKHFIVTTTDKDGVITDANERFCEISGFSREELVGKPHNICRHPDVPAEVFKEMWKAVSEKKAFKGVIKNRRKDGGFFVADSTVFPLLDSNGEIREYMGVRQDVTEYERMREEARQKEQLILKQQQEQETLKAVNATKDSFLVLFTHELKTPLNAIINFSEYVHKKIAESDIDQKTKLIKLLTSIRHNGNFMLETVQNLLDTARLKSGKLNISKSIVSVNDLVTELVREYDSLLAEREKELEMKLTESIYAHSDAVRLKQLIGNLLSNAIKYSRHRILIEMSSLSEEKGRQPFRITIEDDGPGIKEKDLVFALFTQETPVDLDRSVSGTGVGLYFVKLLCSELDFKITLKDSKKLGGAQFILTKESA